MRSTSLVLALVVGVGFAGRGDTAPLANDRYGHMHMKYEKTFLGVDVANIDVRFDEATRDDLRQIAAGQRYSEQIAERIARAALGASDVEVQVRFLRNASLGDFLEAARNNLENARKTGYISQAIFETAWAEVQHKFAPLRERGFKKGDRLIYRASPGALRTTVMSRDRALTDVTTRDEGARRAMIASYFAPGSAFRKDLIKGVFA